MKKQIALVSVTLNAVNPMTEYLSSRDPELHLVNYLDSYLLEKVGNEGGINDSSVRRMFDMLSTACADGADGVNLPCTIFSPYVQYFSGLWWLHVSDHGLSGTGEDESGTDPIDHGCSCGWVFLYL